MLNLIQIQNIIYCKKNRMKSDWISKEPNKCKASKKQCLKLFLKILFSLRYLIFGCLIIIVSFHTFYWLNTIQRINKDISNEPIKKDEKTTTESNKVLPVNLKYILLWSTRHHAPFHFFEPGQSIFSRHSCRYQNCYVTEDRNFLPDLKMFHAIAFNGAFLKNIAQDKLPQERSRYQKYIFYNLEPSELQPVCQRYFDKFFNWASTYKLKSDLLLPYFQAFNKSENVIAPKLVPNWIPFEKMSKVEPNVTNILRSKSRAAAWFISNCNILINNRRNYVKSLQMELKLYNLTVDVYGLCGNYSCPREKDEICTKKLERDYYFYLAFENSFDEDYVTEKVLKGLNHYAVPIVYGGASYERFLPPHSYIDATVLKEKELASLMVKLIKSPDLYMDYFRWRNYYHFRESFGEMCVCPLCEALNDENRMAYFSVYRKFRLWWNPNYKKHCGFL